MTYVCPVCGWDMPVEPDNYNICSCCGTEFGHDDLIASHWLLRQYWIDNGMKWFSNFVRPPIGWDPAVQLRRAH